MDQERSTKNRSRITVERLQGIRKKNGPPGIGQFGIERGLVSLEEENSTFGDEYLNFKLRSSDENVTRTVTSRQREDFEPRQIYHVSATLLGGSSPTLGFELVTP
ncbi:hypothetical protein TNCV_3044051 [Trichonephila clavipes]|nr:hypothetical protein TNCV_3044051 [Trichonephila clavipes]